MRTFPVSELIEKIEMAMFTRPRSIADSMDVGRLHVSAHNRDMSIALNQTIPLLRIFDEGRARAFYVDYLGFSVDWVHRFEPDAPAYLQVSRGGCVLHLTEHHGDCSPAGTVFIRMEGIEALHREITSRPYPYLRPGIEEAPWSARVMELTDPFRNRLRFNEYLSASGDSPS